MQNYNTMKITPSEYKILIVDDVTSNVLLLKVLLTNEKFNVITANSGKQALELVENDRPDLVLLDVMMPEMNGFEVAQILKQKTETSEIPIIFLTALNGTTDPNATTTTTTTTTTPGVTDPNAAGGTVTQ